VYPQLFGELQRGKSVTAVNGRTIHPHQVTSTPTMPGPCLIVVDCPSLDYLSALQLDPTLQQLQQESQQQQGKPQQQQQQEEANAGQPAQPEAAAAAAAGAPDQNGSSSSSEAGARKRFILVHMGPTQVSRSDSYAAWCAGFGPAAHHLFVSNDTQLCSTTRKAAGLQAQLNVIEPEVFTLQGFEASAQQNKQQQAKQEQLAAAGAGDGPVAAAAAAPSRQGVDAADGLVFGLVPARNQGINLEAAITQPPDLEAVQVRTNMLLQAMHKQYFIVQLQETGSVWLTSD
jgi:hypothetical protein